jgi:hypothetical protein
VSGWLVGLPFTSAPIAFFLARDHGVDFAATAAAGIMAGTISQAAFCVAYTRVARRAAWPLAAFAGAVGFAIATAVLVALVALPLPLLALLVFAALAAALPLLPAAMRRPTAVTPPPRWDLPARMAAATAFVLGLTALAGALGPRLTGLLAPFPFYAAVLAVFAHALDGAPAATSVLRGLLFGLAAAAAFFLVLAATLQVVGIGVAFVVALAVSLGVQGASLWALRRRPASGAG